MEISIGHAQSSVASIGGSFGHSCGGALDQSRISSETILQSLEGAIQKPSKVSVFLDQNILIETM